MSTMNALRLDMQQQPPPVMSEAAAPVVVEDDSPQLIRPVALKVIRPIPQRATEAFYAMAYEQGLPMAVVHSAAADAHEWHRKWTYGDESGHDPWEDLRQGAKNPSPEEEDQQRPKRNRYEPEYNDNVSPLSPMEEDDFTNQKDAERAIAKRAKESDSIVLVKPVALRISRPAAVHRPSFYIGTIPSDIEESAAARLSPLTLPSMSASTCSQLSRPVARDVAHLVLDDALSVAPVADVSVPRLIQSSDATVARDGILQALAADGGETTSKEFQACLEVLHQAFCETSVNVAGDDSTATEGMWLTLTKPTFFGQLGENDNGDPMYTLGRMAFDMFSPTNLVCSLQGNFNSVERVGLVGCTEWERQALLESVPKSLREEVEAGESVLRTYK